MRRSGNRTLYTYRDDLPDESEIHGALITAPTSIAGRFIVVSGSRIAHVRLGDCPNLRLRDCEVDTVDAANAQLEQAGWREVRIVGSRFTGARLNGSRLHDVRFESSRLDHMQLQGGRLRQVRFEDCDLRSAYFNDTVMPESVFAGSNLTGADFSNADITGSDLRRAIIEDIRIAPTQLHKVIVSSDQAIYLSRLFGLDVRE